MTTKPLSSIAALRDLLDNLNPKRMASPPFAGGYKPTGKHAKGRKGQAHKKRNGGTKRKQTQPHPSTVAARSVDETQAAA